MSNQQNVWVGSINLKYVNVYPIRSHYPEIYNPVEHNSLQAKIVKMRDLEQYKDSEELSELRKRNNELSEISIGLSSTFKEFRKLKILPDSLWIMSDNVSLPTESEYLFSGGGTILNEACANVLKQFNLGQTALAPVQIHKYGSTELWSEETFYFLNSCEKRKYVKAKQSEEYFTYDNHLIKNRTHRLKVEMADNYLELDQSATDCDVDLWHDPCFSSGYFFSERLHNALVEAGLDKKWDMHRCKLTCQ